MNIIDDYLKFLKTKSGKASNTIKAYKKDVSEFLDYLKLPFETIKKEDLELYINHLNTDLYLSKKTISRKINSIKSFFNFILRNKLVTENPAINLAYPKLNESLPKILSKDECDKLRSACSDNIKTYTMIELMLQTGIRISELSNLKINEIDTSKAQIKMHGDKKTIPLNNKIKFILKAYLDELHKNRKTQNYPLFYTSRGKKINVRNIRLEIDNLIMKADLYGIKVNDFRNTFIVRQLEAGFDKEQLAEMVGHKSLKSTERYLDLFQINNRKLDFKIPVEV